MAGAIFRAHQSRIGEVDACSARIPQRTQVNGSPTLADLALKARLDENGFA
jgi:hypothetical protein